jgi:hypothetical protein
MLYDGIDLIEGSVIANLTVQSGTEFPSSSNASLGEMFFRTDLQQMYVYKNTGWQELSTIQEQLLKANFSGPVVQTTGTSRFYPPSGFFITKVYCSVGTVGSSTIEVDVKVDGTSIFDAVKPTIAAGQNKGEPVIVNKQYSDGSYITVDVTQASGSDLTVYILYKGI